MNFYFWPPRSSSFSSLRRRRQNSLTSQFDFENGLQRGEAGGQNGGQDGGCEKANANFRHCSR